MLLVNIYSILSVNFKTSTAAAVAAAATTTTTKPISTEPDNGAIMYINTVIL